MKPILYDEFEKTFDSNGLGILSDAIKCHVTEELNGQFELMMTYPIMGIHYEDISQRCILLAKPDPVRKSQPFRVYRITKPMNGIVTVYARHIAYDLNGIPVNPFKANGVQLTLQALKNNAITPCPFSFFTDKSTSAEMSVRVPKSIWSLLGGSEGSVLDVYRGEWEFDCFRVNLWNHRGTDRGVTIRYGKNLTSLEQDENCANCYTGICPYWTSYEGDTVLLPERIVKTPGTYTYERILPLDLSNEWSEKPTDQQLRTRAERYIKDNDVGLPKVSLKVEFVTLDQTDEYKDLVLLERVLLGDTVSVSFAKLGVDATARVVRIEYDSILERYVRIYLGSVKSNIVDTIVHQQQQIEKAPTTTDLEKAKIAATTWLTNGKGYKVERRDENGNTIDTLYMDTPDINTAVNVLRIGQSGIGFSHSGVNGPYVSAWTIDGVFNADFILAGILNAALIKAGVLQSKDGKTFVLDLEAGTLRMQANEFSIAGKTVDQIADKSADGKVTLFSQKLNQAEVLKRLTNGGTAQGIFLGNDGQLYINASYLAAGELKADIIKLLGTFSVYKNGKKTGGIGYIQGSTGQKLTDGVGIRNLTEDCHVAVTDEGIALKAGNNTFYITRTQGGKFACNVVVDGDVIVNGTVRAFNFVKS